MVDTDAILDVLYIPHRLPSFVQKRLVKKTNMLYKESAAMVLESWA